MTNAQAPSVGSVVHYQSYGTLGGEYTAEARAAIVTQIGDGELGDVVGLAVINPTGMFFTPNVPFAEEPTPGHWSWPPRN